MRPVKVSGSMNLPNALKDLCFDAASETIIPNLNLVPSVCGKAAPLHDLFASLFIWFQSLVYPPHYLFSLPLVISGRCNKWEAWKRNLMEKTCGKKIPSRRVVDG